MKLTATATALTIAILALTVPVSAASPATDSPDARHPCITQMMIGGDGIAFCDESTDEFIVLCIYYFHDDDSSGEFEHEEDTVIFFNCFGGSGNA